MADKIAQANVRIEELESDNKRYRESLENIIGMIDYYELSDMIPKIRSIASEALNPTNNQP